MSKPAPRTKENLLNDLDATWDALEAANERYNQTKGTNPNGSRIAELNTVVSALRLQLEGATRELEFLKAEPTPSDRIVRDIAEATQRVQDLAREAYDIRFRELSKEKFDVSDPQRLDDVNHRTLKYSDTLLSVRNLTIPYFVRFAMSPALDGIRWAAENAYDGIRQLKYFLTK